MFRTAVLAVSFAAALSAAQWLPSLEVARRSARWNLTEQARTFWSVHPLGMSQVLWPVPLSDLPLRPEQRAVLFESRDAFLHSLYLGMPALALVAAAFTRRRPRLDAFALVAVAALLVSLGRHTPVFALASLLFPPLQMLRYPAKAMLLASFAWAILAGAGFDAWREAHVSSRRSWLGRIALPLAIVAATGAVGALSARYAPETWSSFLDARPDGRPLPEILAPATRTLTRSTLLATLALVATLLARGSRIRALHSATFVALLAVVDLSILHRDLNPTAPRALFTHRPEILKTLGTGNGARLYVYDYFFPGRSGRYLKRDHAYRLARAPEGWSPAAARALGLRTYLFPPAGATWGVDGSYDADVPGISDAQLARLTETLRSVEGTPVHRRLLQLGGVASVVALHGQGFEDLVPAGTWDGFFDEPIRLFRVPDPLPRAYAVGEAIGAEGREAFATLFDPGFDPARQVVLSAALEPETPGRVFSGSSRIVERHPDRLSLEAELSGPGYVVLVEAYDPGWRASVDGRPAELLRANLAFRAVAVPAGKHLIEMAYRPRGLVVGLVVSVAALLAVGLGGLSSRLRR